MTRFRKVVQINAPVEELFAWHERPGAFERLTPPWEPVEVKAKQGSIHDGDWLKMKLGPLEWHARHSGYIPNQQFIDTQSRGPFALWRHRHIFNALEDHRSELIDEIEYRLPLSPFSAWAAPLIRARLERMFAYRHRITQHDLACHSHYLKGQSPMKILISGASGLVGSNLSPFLTAGGHQVSHLVRRSPRNDREIFWKPSHHEIDLNNLEGFDAWIHLAGESIAGGRWTEERKKRILESRSQGTALLAQSLHKLESPPKVVISASAVGYYGDRGTTLLQEEAPPGNGFLAEVCQAWEAASKPMDTLNTRLVNLRLGVVLSSQGGALKTMLPPFLLGVGGKLGDGKQYMSWIGIDDVLRCIYHCLYTEELSGPVNAVSPNAVENEVFTEILGKVLKRPSFFQVPDFAMRFALGEMADEMLLSSTRVSPQALLKSGFEFQFGELQEALTHVLGRP